jgi:hypothetical protein
MRYDIWHMRCDMACEMWHLIYDIWVKRYDICQMRYDISDMEWHMLYDIRDMT